MKHERAKTQSVDSETTAPDLMSAYLLQMTSFFAPTLPPKKPAARYRSDTDDDDFFDNMPV